MQASPKRTGDSASSALGKKTYIIAARQEGGKRKKKNAKEHTLSLPEDLTGRGTGFAMVSTTVGEAA